MSKSSPGIPNKCHYCTSPETFSHLLRCDNPLSATFRTQILEDADTYMTNKSFPPEIRTDLLGCLSWSLDPNTIAQYPHGSCTHQQISLGPNAFLKGLFHQSWQKKLSSLLSRSTNEETTNAEDLLAGFVNTLWNAQLEFWKAHTNAIHTSTTTTFSTIHYKLVHYQQRIRQLYALKDQCLHIHQEQYFPPDLDQYLSESTLTQMKQYLFYYEPAIRQSLQQAKKQPQRRLTTFPGFFRTTIQAIRNIPARSMSSLRTTLQRHTGVQGAPTHHRHTRWRSPITSKPLQSFFSSETNT